MIERKRPTSLVRAKKVRERVYNVPLIESDSGAVGYGSEVKLLSITEQEEYSLTLKKHHEYLLLNIPPVHALILNKREGDVVSWGEYTYKILKIA